MVPASTDEEVDQLLPDTPRSTLGHPLWNSIREPTQPQPSNSSVSTSIRKVRALVAARTHRDRTQERTRQDYRVLRAKTRYLSSLGWEPKGIATELDYRLNCVIKATTGTCYNDDLDEDERYVSDAFRVKHQVQNRVASLAPVTPKRKRRNETGLGALIASGPQSVVSKRARREIQENKNESVSKRAKRAKVQMMTIVEGSSPSSRSVGGTADESSQDGGIVTDNASNLTSSAVDTSNVAVEPLTVDTVSKSEPFNHAKVSFS